MRLCIDLDASWRPLRRTGARRAYAARPCTPPPQAGALAAQIAGRPGFRLVGLMSYEAQIAGLGDAPPGRRCAARLIRADAAPVATWTAAPARRGGARRYGEHADLEFVNGGGTGSMAADRGRPGGDRGHRRVRAVRADALRRTTGPGGRRPRRSSRCRWSAAPAPGIATVLGGGWVASGPAGPDRLPTPWLPAGLRLIRHRGRRRGADAADRGGRRRRCAVGDRVWFRHAKAGELCEHVNELHLVDGDRIVQTVPTYRGEGQAFL